MRLLYIMGLSDTSSIIACYVKYLLFVRRKSQRHRRNDHASLEVNQGGCLTCLIPSTVGNNWMDNYVGPNNPTNRNGSENFSVRPVNYSDAHARGHDITYTKMGAAGPTSVFFNISVMQADYTLIGQSFSTWWDGGPNMDADMNDRGQSLAIGLGIGLATAPKSVIYWIDQAAKNIPASEWPGL